MELVLMAMMAVMAPGVTGAATLSLACIVGPRRWAVGNCPALPPVWRRRVARFAGRGAGP